MLRMHREDSKTSMCILKLDNQVTKLDQDTKKSFCLLRFEINGTSVAEDLVNFAMFSVHRVVYTSASSVIVNRNMSNGYFKK